MRLSVGSYNFIRSLTGGDGVLSKAMVSETLEADEFTYRLMATKDYEPLADVDDDDLYDVDDLQLYALGGDALEIDEDDFVRGMPADFYDDEDNLILRLYVNKIERVSKNAYTLYCLSAVGLLIYIEHNGGMYSNALLGDVINDILQGTLNNGVYTSIYGFDYVISPDVASQLVTGHLPIASCRDNLLSALFPYGVSIIKELDGTLSFEFSLAQSVMNPPAKNMYVGAIVPHSDHVTHVTVREHEYIEDNTITPIVLADFSTAVSGVKVIFNQPCHTLTGGLTVSESNCNYAIVSGIGQLSGIPYAHITTDRTAPTLLTGTRKEAAVKNMTLVNSLNGLNTLNRLINYYANAQTITCDLKLNWYNDAQEEETHIKSGDFITIEHPYTREETLVCVKNLDITLSAIVKAKATLIANWVPKYLGNTYNNFIFIENSFTVPAGVTAMRLVLCGGGQGGRGGDTAEAWTPFDPSLALIGSGAEGGTGGDPGKIFIADIAVNPGDVISVTLGQGGSGGNTSTDGSLGTASTATVNGTTYTSADGGVLPYGYTNMLTGDVYARKGPDGYAGKNGGAKGDTYYGEDFVLNGVTYKGGKGIFGNPYNTPAGGGGAAYKANGYDAVYTVNAGEGASPLDADDATSPGSGGGGGHGGGGHGERMQKLIDGNWTGVIVYGGTGSKGGKGGPGFVLGYY